MYTKEDIIDLQNDIEYWKNKCDELEELIIIKEKEIDDLKELLDILDILNGGDDNE